VDDQERGETPAEELKRLRREVAQLKRDKEILKKAAVFFAKGD
jgi:transposase